MGGMIVATLRDMSTREFYNVVCVAFLFCMLFTVSFHLHGKRSFTRNNNCYFKCTIWWLLTNHSSIRSVVACQPYLYTPIVVFCM